MRGTRRPVLFIVAMAAAILLADGVGMAATLQGTEGNDTLQGTENPDYLYGLGGDDTIDGWGYNDVLYGGAGNDTLKDRGGWDLGWWGDVFSGDDGDDLIDATTKYAYDGTYIAPWTGKGPAPYADHVYCGDGFDRVWYDRFDYVYWYYGQASGAYCESLLRIDLRTSGQVKGAFYREGSSVTFDSRLVSGGGERPGDKRYDKETVSDVWVNNKPFTLKVDPSGDRTITQTTYKAQGYQNTLTDADRKAVLEAADEVARFLGRPSDRGQKNQEALAWQHLSILAESYGELSSFTTTSPDRPAPSGTNALRSNVSMKGLHDAAEGCAPDTSAGTARLLVRSH